LTERGRFDILIKLSARGTAERGQERAARTLKTIQRRENKALSGSAKRPEREERGSEMEQSDSKS